MVGMTNKEKIAVSLPSQLVRAAKSAVRGGRAPNVSAYVADALAEKVMLDDLSALLDEMLAETGGPLTNAERREADEVLGHKKKPRR
jgi:Arc/MetJ-type ribon-helix-helix transcriptional regulator